MAFEYAYTLCGGGAPRRKKFRIGETITAGVPVRLDAASGTATILLVETNGFTDTLGVALESGTYAAATEALVEVLVDPMAVYRVPLCQGQTAGTALTSYSVTTSNATNAFTASDRTTTAQDGGHLQFTTGGCKGQMRVITSEATDTTTTYGFTVGFPSIPAVGDYFYVTALHPSRRTSCATTSNYAEIDASLATNGGAAGLDVVDLDLQEGWVEVVFTDHAWKQGD
jgi:hypothetical protein